MAFTITTLTALSKKIEAHSVNAIPFILNLYTDDASGCEEIKAAVAGKKIIIEQMSLICADKITATIGAGETGAAVTAVVWGPLVFNTEVTGAGYMIGTQYIWKPVHGLVLPAATSLVIDASGAGIIMGTFEGVVV